MVCGSTSPDRVIWESDQGNIPSMVTLRRIVQTCVIHRASNTVAHNSNLGMLYTTFVCDIFVSEPIKNTEMERLAEIVRRYTISAYPCSDDLQKPHS